MANNILVAEDENSLVITLQDNLIAEGFTVATASNGEEAVERIRKRKPDLILLDIFMPKKDGFYVLDELKKNLEWRSVPVFVLSNFGEDTTIKRAIEMGANDYFVKSQHTIEEIISKIREYLEK